MRAKNLFVSDENPDFFPVHLKGSSCVFPECVSCLGSYPQKRTEKDENFSFNTTNSLCFPCDIFSSDIHLIHTLNNKDRYFWVPCVPKKTLGSRISRFGDSWSLLDLYGLRGSRPGNTHAWTQFVILHRRTDKFEIHIFKI